MQIRNRKIMVTGATGGLGHAITRELHRRGASLVITGRRHAELEALAAETDAEVVIADLTKPEDLAGLQARMGNLDVLVANAGVGADSRMAKFSDDEIDFAIDVNLRAPIKMTRAFAQSHIDAGTPGQVVLIGSLSGLAATPETRMYNATKFGLRGFALSIRQDLAEHDIGVSHVLPSFIRDAGMFADNDIDLPPVVRTKSPADVAAGVVKAIESNPVEVYVSPVEMKVTSKLATIAPSMSARIQKLIGAADRAASN